MTPPDTVDAVHPDVDAEQAVLDHAYACLRFMRERALYLKSLGYQGGNVHADTGLTPEMAAADDARKQRRVDSLADPETALCFGRIDRADGERFYIGRRHVEDRGGDPVVTDWRAPVAVPFYRATVADRMALERRRRFVVEGRELLDIFEEDLASPDAETAGAYVPDPLLAEVEHARTGTMRDIVSTIQAEQDAIIRAPFEECVVVQGGPGTGKTAVGLHRVAYLLYTHRTQLERERVLIVGPNGIFFRYIAQVLPSLGESAGVQLTVFGLTGGGFRIRADDPVAVGALKGDARMATVVRNAALARVGAGDGSGRSSLTLATPFGSVVLDGAAVAALVARATAGGQPLNSARSAVRQQLVELAWQTYLGKHGSDPALWAPFMDTVPTSTDLKKALDKLWPAQSAADLVRRLYGNRRLLDRATVGVLSAEERDLLVRRPSPRLADEQWTAADLAVLDEANAVLNGTPQQYGHIIVDEAQDLSAMQLRVVARRSRRGSMTILGDLAQSASAGGQTGWEDAVSAVASASPGARPRLVELTVGYRVPAPILAMANRLLPSAAPGVRPTVSARTRGREPSIIAVAGGGAEASARAVAEVSELADQWSSVALVVPASLRGAVLEALSGAGVAFTDAERTSALGEHITLLSPAACKGLEFDAVVAVEPARIVAESPFGMRLLYVVLTRAVQHLTIVHAEAIPTVLGGQR